MLFALLRKFAEDPSAAEFAPAIGRFGARKFPPECRASANAFDHSLCPRLGGKSRQKRIRRHDLPGDVVPIPNIRRFTPFARQPVKIFHRSDVLAQLKRRLAPRPLA